MLVLDWRGRGGLNGSLFRRKPLRRSRRPGLFVSRGVRGRYAAPQGGASWLRDGRRMLSEGGWRGCRSPPQDHQLVGVPYDSVRLTSSDQGVSLFQPIIAQHILLLSNPWYNYALLLGHRTPGRHRILEGFRPDKAMLEKSAQELVEERREALEILRMG